MQRIRLLILLLATALTGTAVTAGSAAARGNVLPDATYEVILQVNNEFADLDNLTDSEISAKQRLTEARAICRNYPTGDPLLKNRRDRCLESTTRGQLESKRSACKTWPGCLRLQKQIGASDERDYRLMTQSNRIVSETVPAGPCRAALLFTSSEMRYWRQAGRLDVAYAQAWMEDDKRGLKALRKRFKQLNKLKVRTGKQFTQEFAAHC